MVSVSTLTGILSGGVAGSVISAIWNHFSKRSLQQQQEGFTKKLATLEHDFQRSQSRVQAEIDRSVFVTRAHFETEFEAMKDVFSCLSETRLAINGVRPMISLEPADETETEKFERLSERLKALMIANDKLLATFEKKAPFYTEELYEAVDKCYRAARMETDSIRASGKDALRHDGYSQGRQNQVKFSEGYVNSVTIIRNRISKLAILPGR
jgi:hypothetical protein